MTVKKTYPPDSTTVPPTPSTDTLTTVPPVPHPVCEIGDLPDGSVIITLRVEAQVMKRHRSRANGMPIDRYMWENILHRALVDSVF